MRSRLCRACGDFHDLSESWPCPIGASAKGPQVVGDLKPYRSMIDGSVIDGRKRHRDHLKAHGCMEVGNDTSHMQRKAVPLPSRKQSLHRLMADMGDRDVQRIVQQEIRNRR